ncbi:aromatic ring-opening dioxygenase LigA [Streptomyces nanshensis]|nr:aromatic ring-opening dioxygenase LigA [Streptomyces nanshensis]
MASSVPPLPKIDTFVDALEQLVKLPPGKRGPSPLVLLSQLGDGREAELIADGLCARFRVGGRARVPYAQVAGQPSGPRNERIGDVFQKLEQELERNRPGGFGKLRLPQFTLMCSVIETDLTERQSSVQARELRDRCFAERRKDSNFLKVLATVSGGDQAPAGIPAFLWYWTRQPLFNVLPRWLYGRLQERRMTHKGSWYRQWADLPRGTGFFHDATRFAGIAPVPTLEQGLLSGLDDNAGEEPETDEEHAERLDRTTGVLLRALLADLEAAFRRPRLSPWGRRRKSRFVIVLPQIDGSPEWVSRLVEQFPVAVEQTGSMGVVLVSAERSEGERTESFAEAAITLRSWQGTTGSGGARAVRVGIEPHAEDQGAARWLGRHPEIYPERNYSDGAPRAEAVLCAVLALGVLGGAGVYGVNRALDNSSTRCIGAAVAEARSSGGSRIPDDWQPDKVYEQARELVRQNNRAADRAEKENPDAVVRTVVYLGVPVHPGAGDEAMYSGAIPELRGVALAQRQLNNEASMDQKHKVYLRVRVADAGEKFSKAPAVARDIADEVKSGKSEEILGVVGLGQSRTTTMEARDILGDEAKLPMIGTVATAEEMQDHQWYRQVAPDNGREARIAADFARRGNIVQTGTETDTCVPARKAVVIADPDDKYSDNLSRRFTEEFERGRPDTAHTLWYSPDGEPNRRRTGGRSDGEWVASPSEMAKLVCRRLTKDPRTVVYWAERSNEFGAFLNYFDGEGECKGRVSVLGGNDLTNSVVDDQQPSVNHPDARLYYAAHALPASYPQTSRARTFRRVYQQEYDKNDHWSNDGRTPLAWDAMLVISQAVDTAREESGTAGLTRGTVRGNVVAGSEERGATGPLNFGRGDGVPENKRLLILHDTARGAEVALECGMRDDGDEHRTWGTKDEFACPRDQEN